jgi:hypothetical protein
MNNPPENPKSPWRAPSARATAALAAAMLAIGVAVGAAIGPAPSTSFAVGQLLPLLPSLSGASKSPTATASAPAVTAQQTPSPAKPSAASTAASGSGTKPSQGETASSSSQPEATAPPATTPTSTGKAKATALPPVTKTWLIELAATSFAEAAAQPSAAPYIDTQALAAGTLLNAWSAIDASAFANDTTLIAGTPPQLLDTIVQPPCPAPSPEGEGAAGATCAPDTPGALTAADEFLKATLATITGTAAYRENGLIVVTFASVASATATGLPAGAATATLTSQPPAGALLISPFAKAGAKSSVAFAPTSPKQSLEKLLRR